MRWRWCMLLTFLCTQVGKLQNVVLRGGICVTCPTTYTTKRRLSASGHSMTTQDSPGQRVASCVFCQICGDNPSGTDLLFSDDDLVVFRDIRPAAKHHFLVVTREHIRDAKALTPRQRPLVERMVAVARQVLREQGAVEDDADVRLGFHWPPFHSVSHLHLHAISPTTDMGLISRVIFKPNTWWFVTPEYVLSRL